MGRCLAFGYGSVLTSANARRASTSAFWAPCVMVSRRQAIVGISGLAVVSLSSPSMCQPMIATSGPETDYGEALAAFRRVTKMQDAAFDLTNRGDFAGAERYWDELIALNEKNAAAWSNRGNCRTSQGRFREAINDFDKAIELAPEEPDCHLGKGVALEGLCRFEHALVEYEAANDLSIRRYGSADSVAINNRGNANGALGNWEKAADDFHLAATMSRDNVFARANEAYALYELGNTEKAVKMMESLLRKYPTFVDVRAALVAVYWTDQSRRGEAEEYWLAVLEEDVRYREPEWVAGIRRWPPRLVRQLDNFRTLK